MIKGCQVIFPDTVFFLKDGRIDCLIQSDKDWCLSYLIEQKKLNLLAIRKKIPEIVKTRQANKEMMWVLKDLNKRMNNYQNKNSKAEIGNTSTKAKANYAAPIIKNDPNKEQQDVVDKEYEMALFRFRRKQDLRNEFGVAPNLTGNDFSSVAHSEGGDEREKQMTNNVRV